MNEMSLGTLIDLAKLGLKKVKEDQAKNIVSWLGELPTESDLTSAGFTIYHATNGYGQMETHRIELAE